MKNKSVLKVFVLAFLLTPLSVNALEWTCPDMKGFVDAMYEAATYLNNKPNFDENPKIEKDIDQIMIVMNAIAEDEDIKALSDAVEEMDKVWQKEQWKGDDIGDFRRALDSSTVNLERVYEKYCDK